MASEHRWDGIERFGGHLNVFGLTKAMIAAGAAGVHFVSGSTEESQFQS